MKEVLIALLLIMTIVSSGCLGIRSEVNPDEEIDLEGENFYIEFFVDGEPVRDSFELVAIDTLEYEWEIHGQNLREDYTYVVEMQIWFDGVYFGRNYTEVYRISQEDEVATGSNFIKALVPPITYVNTSYVNFMHVRLLYAGQLYEERYNVGYDSMWDRGVRIDMPDYYTATFFLARDPPQDVYISIYQNGKVIEKGIFEERTYITRLENGSYNVIAQTEYLVWDGEISINGTFELIEVSMVERTPDLIFFGAIALVCGVLIMTAIWLMKDGNKRRLGIK